MTRLTAFVIAFSVMSLVFGVRPFHEPSVLAENKHVIFPSRAYTAEYENLQSNDPDRPDLQRVSCNGNGLLIYEWNKLRFLYDAQKQLEFIIDPRDKIINIHRSTLEQSGAEWLDEEMFSQSSSEFARYKQLSDEKMTGHNCRVYVNAESEKRWYDIETKVLVFRKLDYGEGITLVTKLLKYSPQALPSKEFELPKGYEVR